MKATKFTWREWKLTGAEENLLKLSNEARQFFRLFAFHYYN
jgi:hypothetical protein